MSGVVDIARRDHGFALALGDWADDAACAGRTDVDFFPETNQAVERTHRLKAAPALAVCATCTVTAQCLKAAMAVPPGSDWGVWGGTTVHDRARMRGRRKPGS